MIAGQSKHVGGEFKGSPAARRPPSCPCNRRALFTPHGKTTVALGLAVAAARAGYATAIVDLDPQASAAKWKVRRAEENPAVVSAQVPRLKQTMEAARSGGVDFAFIDTAGRKDDSALNAARCSDLVLIPTRSSIVEIETLPEVNDLLRLAGSPPAFVVLNCVHPSTGHRGIADTHGTIKELFELSVCPIHICQRSAYAEAPTSGQSPQELDAEGKAADEPACVKTPRLPSSAMILQ
jgi:chromosome partitioning protein